MVTGVVASGIVVAGVVAGGRGSVACGVVLGILSFIAWSRSACPLIGDCSKEIVV